MENHISISTECLSPKIKKQVKWTKDEDNLLLEAAKQHNFRDWVSIAKHIPGRTQKQCNLRYLQIRPEISKGTWTNEEDFLLLKYYEIYGNNWRAISKRLKTRNSKQIRDRFINCLDPNAIVHSNFTEQDDQKLIQLYPKYRQYWKKYVKYFPNRTSLMIKNRFLRKLNWVINQYKKKKNMNDIHPIMIESNNDQKDQKSVISSDIDESLQELKRKDPVDRKNETFLYITNEVDLTIKHKWSGKNCIDLERNENKFLLNKIVDYKLDPPFDLLESKVKSLTNLETNIYETMVNLLQLQYKGGRDNLSVEKEIDCLMKLLDLTYLKLGVIKNNNKTDNMLINDDY